MGKYEDAFAEIGRELDADLSAENVTPPTPPSGVRTSGVYTGANQNSGAAETSFGDWRGREVEEVLTFTPDDKWDTSWWCGVYGGSYPYRDRLVITRGLCLKGQNVETSLPGDVFADWAQAVKSAGIHTPIYRLGHEANGDWYPWKIQGHETTWAKRFDLAAAQIHDTDPDARVMFCLAAGQSVEGFDMPKNESVDVYGVDLYDRNGHKESWADHVAIAHEYGVPLCVPEWGLWDTAGGGHGDNPSYIDWMADQVRRDCADGSESYFNKNSSGIHVLSSYPNGEQRYLERFGGTMDTRSIGNAPSVQDPDEFRSDGYA